MTVPKGSPLVNQLPCLQHKNWTLEETRQLALHVIIIKPGGTFNEVLNVLVEEMIALRCVSSDDLWIADHAISSLSYDGFIYLSTCGTLYPINYSSKGLPRRHRLRLRDNAFFTHDSLEAELAAADTR